jgi:hypothetical protein
MTILSIGTAGAPPAEWSGSYPELLRVTGTAGRAAVPNVALPAGRYVLQLSLDAPALPFGLDPATGIAEQPIAWRLALMPTSDEKLFAVTKDDAQVATPLHCTSCSLTGWFKSAESLLLQPTKTDRQ